MEHTVPSPDRLFAIDPDLGDLPSSRWLPDRGYGVGKLLMKKIIHIVYETSANIAFRILSVDAKNTDEAFRLYHESGFMQGQTRQDHETAFYLDAAPVFTALKEQRKSAT